MKKRTIWNGDHNGITFEIVNWGEPKTNAILDQPTGMWNYYVYITDRQLSREDFEIVWIDPVAKKLTKSSSYKHARYREYDSPFWAGINFHGGITAFEGHKELGTGYRHVKVGCDYSHLWDNGMHFSASELERDAKNTINQITEHLRFKIRCSYTGLYVYEENGIWKTHNKTGSQFFSKSGWNRAVKSEYFAPERYTEGAPK